MYAFKDIALVKIFLLLISPTRGFPNSSAIWVAFVLTFVTVQLKSGRKIDQNWSAQQCTWDHELKRQNVLKAFIFFLGNTFDGSGKKGSSFVCIQFQF